MNGVSDIYNVHKPFCISTKSIINTIFALSIIVFPLQWFTFADVAEISGLTFNIVHIPVVLGIFLLTILSNKREKIIALMKVGGGFVGFYLLYLVILFVAMLWTDPMTKGVSIIARNSIYFSFFAIIAILTPALNDKSIVRIAYKFVPLGLLVFVGIAVYIYVDLGRNIFRDYVISVLAGDAQELQFGFYPTLFNYSGGKIIPKESADYTGTEFRNALIGVFVLYLILLNISKKAYFLNSKKLVWRWINHITVFLLYFLIIFSVSRSNILVLVFVLLMASVIARLRSRKTTVSYRKFVVLWVLMFVVFTTGIVCNKYILNIYNMMSSRFEVISNDPRIPMYKEAIRGINDNLLLGKGLGTNVETGIGKLRRVHNLFMSSWLETGIGGFAVSVLFYVAIVFVWMYYMFLTVQYPNRWVLELCPEWVMTLPVLPLFRSMICGAGEFTFVEWFCLGLFFGCIVRNENFYLQKKFENMGKIHSTA